MMPTTVVRRRHLVVIAAGYAGGIAAFPWLPGPYFEPGEPLILRLALAFLMPTAALVSCLATDVPFRRPDSGVSHSASLRAVSTVVLCVAVFMISLHGLLLAGLVGLPISRLLPHRLVVVLTGLLVIGVGNVLPRIRPNIVIGIRTDRLLENPTAWARVHWLIGYCLVALGAIIVVAGLTFSKHGIPLLVSAALVVGITLSVAAYWKWTRG